MTQSLDQAPGQQPQSGSGQDPVPPGAPPRKGRSRRGALAGAAVAAVVIAGLGGYAAGASGTGATQRSLARTRIQLGAARTQLGSARGALAQERTRLQSAQVASQQATARAQAQAQAKYASAMSALRRRQQTLAKTDRTVNAEAGRLQASSISADGVYVVGSDIRQGVWHTPGDGSQSGSQCYFATLGSTNTSDIIDNNDFDGPETVDLSGAYAFEINGPCTWYRTG